MVDLSKFIGMSTATFDFADLPLAPISANSRTVGRKRKRGHPVGPRYDLRLPLAIMSELIATKRAKGATRAARMVALSVSVPGASFHAKVRSLLRYHKLFGREFAARLRERPLSQRGKLPWQFQELFDALDGRSSSRDTGIRWNLVAAGYIRPRSGLEQYLWNLRRYRILSSCAYQKLGLRIYS